MEAWQRWSMRWTENPENPVQFWGPPQKMKAHYKSWFKFYIYTCSETLK